MALVFDPTAHEYFLDGPQVPSTTGILRDSGLIRLDHIPAFVLEKARVRGSAVHQLVHYLAENDLDWTSVDPAYLRYLHAWQLFQATVHLTPLLSEYRVASRRHRVAGTLDLLGEIAGEGWLLDWKTGNPDHVAADYQTSSYLGMCFEWALQDERLAEVLSRHKRWRRAAVRLCNDGTYRVTEYIDPRDYSRFQTLAAAWHIRNERGAAAFVQMQDLAA